VTGTLTLTRLALRLDRVRLTVWVFLLAVTPVLTVAQYQKVYPTDQALQAIGGVLDNRSLIALSGPVYHLSIGGLSAWKVGYFELVLIALVNLLTVVRHTRAEEEDGRSDLIGSTVVGRFAPVTAAILTAGLVDLAVAVLVGLTVAGTGLPIAGSIAWALGIAVTGLLFAAVAALTAQVSTSARTATSIAVVVLGAAYLLRAVGDLGPTWSTWLSPIAWGREVRPYTGDHWWVAALPVGLAAALLAVAYRLAARRDLGAGLLPERAGPALAAPGLRSPFALAWRLHRGVLAGWLLAMTVTGLVLGGAAAGLPANANLSPQMTDLLARMAGRKGFIDEYLAAVIGIIGLVVAAYAVQVTQRLRLEETSGRLEPLLATPVGRLRWAAGHLVIALGGTAALLAVAGAAGGLAYGVQSHDAGQVPRLLGAALAQVPATWVLAGLGVALFGLVPRWAAAGWAALVACVVLLELGAFLGLNHWVVDLSPFAHAPKLPGSALHAGGLTWLVLVSAALTAAGLAGLRRRDIG
jgi:polyether ionophore transport system permease protein